MRYELGLVGDNVLKMNFAGWTLELAVATAGAANYCDHAEHNEEVECLWITDAGRVARRLACAIAADADIDLLDFYANRLRTIETRNPLSDRQGFDGSEAAMKARNWRQLQLVQVEHDRHYHPDVFGLSRFAQLNHYTLHLAKLTGALADVAAGKREAADFYKSRLADLLLFGVKLATVTGEVLPERTLFSDDSGRLLTAA